MNLHALMTLNLCIESYGAAVHVMDALMGVSAEQTRRPLRSMRLARSMPGAIAALPTLGESLIVADPTFDDHVQEAVRRMPFQLAHAVWLVDVCGCSYDTAAAELVLSRDAVAQRVADGRRSIHAHVMAQTDVAPVG